MIQEIKLTISNNIVPKVNKKEPPRSINQDLTPFSLLLCLSGLKIQGRHTD
jgi:hypothetical protein